MTMRGKLILRTRFSRSTTARTELAVDLGEELVEHDAHQQHRRVELDVDAELSRTG